MPLSAAALYDRISARSEYCRRRVRGVRPRQKIINRGAASNVTKDARTSK